MKTSDYTYLLSQLYKEVKAKKWSNAHDTYQRILEEAFFNGKIPELFRELLDIKALQAFENVELMRYNRNEVIFREGDKPDAMYIIIKGSVAISQKSFKTKIPVLPLPPVLVNYVITRILTCKPKKIATLTTGNFFGEMGIISSKPRTASVIAEEDLEVVRITREDINKAIKVKPGLYSLLKAYYTSRLDALIDSLKDINNNVNACMVDTVLESITAYEKKYTVDNELFCKISDRSAYDKKINLLKYSDLSEKVFQINNHLENITILYKSGKKREALTEYFFLFPDLIKDLLSDFLTHQINLASSFLVNIAELLKMLDKFYKIQVILPINIPQVSVLVKIIEENIRVKENAPTLTLHDSKQFYILELLKDELTNVPIESFNDGQIIISYGDTSDHLYLIREGKVRAYSMLINQDVQSEGEQLKAGDLFGEFCYLMKKPWMTTVIADGRVTVYKMERSLVDKLIIQYPEVLDYLKKRNIMRINALIEEADSLKEFYKEELALPT